MNSCNHSLPMDLIDVATLERMHADGIACTADADNNKVTFTNDTE